jgi:hypothetical protein
MNHKNSKNDPKKAEPTEEIGSVGENEVGLHIIDVSPNCGLGKSKNKVFQKISRFDFGRKDFVR